MTITPKRLRLDSLADYDFCHCRGLEEHADRWPDCRDDAKACDHPAKAAMKQAGVGRPFFCYVCGELVVP